MNAVEDGTFVFAIDKESMISIDLVEDSKIEGSDSAVIMKPTAFLSGDLLFLAYMMGKPNFASARLGAIGVIFRRRSGRAENAFQSIKRGWGFFS